MKKLKKLLLIMLVLCFVLTMIPTMNVQAAVKLNATSKTIKVGETFTLKVSGTTQKITWSTSDKKIATVTSKGVVKGINRGSATITASVGGKKYNCKVGVRYNTTIEKKTIFNKSGIKISTSSITETDDKYTLKLIIQNSSSSDYSFHAYACSINGLMYDSDKYGFDSVNIPTTKKNILKIEIKKSWMKENNIPYIKYLDVLFSGYDSANYKSLDTNVIQIKTNIYDNVGKYKPSGKKVYADKKVDVYYLGRNENEFKFCIKNKTDEYELTFDNCSVNDWGYKITDYTYDLYDEVILSNTYDYYTLKIDSDFLSEYDIDKITNIEFNLTFDVFNDEEYATGKIKITL